MGSWPIILSTLAVGFVLGVVWHRAHVREREENELQDSVEELIKESIHRG